MIVPPASTVPHTRTRAHLYPYLCDVRTKAQADATFATFSHLPSPNDTILHTSAAKDVTDANKVDHNNEKGKERVSLLIRNAQTRSGLSSSDGIELSPTFCGPFVPSQTLECNNSTYVHVGVISRIHDISRLAALVSPHMQD